MMTRVILGVGVLFVSLSSLLPKVFCVSMFSFLECLGYQKSFVGECFSFFLSPKKFRVVLSL